MLCEAEGGARQGKHQYLSGILHNAAKILEANADHPTGPARALQALGVSPSERIPPGDVQGAVMVSTAVVWMKGRS